MKYQKLQYLWLYLLVLFPNFAHACTCTGGKRNCAGATINTRKNTIRCRGDPSGYGCYVSGCDGTCENSLIDGCDTVICDGEFACNRATITNAVDVLCLDDDPWSPWSCIEAKIGTSESPVSNVVCRGNGVCGEAVIYSTKVECQEFFKSKRIQELLHPYMRSLPSCMDAQVFADCIDCSPDACLGCEWNGEGTDTCENAECPAHGT